MKRKLVVSSVVLLAVSAAALAMVAGSLATPAKTTTLNVWVRDYTIDQDSPYKSAVKKFERLHPDVKVDLVGFPGDALHQKLLLSKAGGAKPDVAQVDTIWLGEMAQNGVAANLDSYYAKWAAGRNDYPANFLASSKWKGHYYGVWLNTDVRELIWSKDVFRKAGLDPNRGPRTWAEVVSMGKQIQSKVPGTSGVGFSAFSDEDTADHWYPFLWMNGGDILNKNWTKAAFNSPAGVRALQFWVDLVRKYKVTPADVITQDSSTVESGLTSGRYGMVLSNAGGGFGDFKDLGKPSLFTKKLGNAMLPTCPGCKPASGSGGWLLAVDSSSKVKDLAFEFIKMVTDGQNALPFAVQQSVMPVRKTIIDKYRNGLPGMPYFDVAAASYKVTHFRPWVLQYPKIAEQITTAIQKALAGKATAKEALDAAAKKTNELLAGK
jgi:multiple sugar transport system substrate-binding protein